MLVEENSSLGVGTMMAKKYAHCPLKKRPVTLVREEQTPPSPPPSLSPHSPRPSAFTPLYVDDVDENNEPENLSTKPEDLSKTGNYPTKATSPAITAKNLPEPKEWPAYVPPPQYLCHTKLELPELARPCPQYAYIPPLYAPYRSPLYDSFNYAARGASLSPPAPFYPHYSPPSPPSPVSSHSYSSPPPPPEDLSSPGSVSSDSGISSLSVKRRREPAPRYQCPDCAKSYSTYSGLSKHQQYHCVAAEGSLAKKSFSCKFCSKVYTSLGALKMHIRTHTLPCKCHLCGKAFSRPWLLQGHIRTHTGEKPFSCHHCRRAFADRSNLRAHLQTHSDVKKYSCSACSKTFSRMSLLSKHMEGGCGSPLPLSLHYDYRPEEVPSY